MSGHDTATIAQRSPPEPKQVLTVADLDGRTRAVRRAKQLVASFTAAVGGKVESHQLVAIQRAAELTAIAEQNRALHLAGHRTVDDVVRADGAAARAVTALRLPVVKPKRLSIAEALAARGIQPPVRRNTEPVAEQQADETRTTEAASVASKVSA
jgi:hypothetical protein